MEATQSKNSVAVHLELCNVDLKELPPTNSKHHNGNDNLHYFLKLYLNITIPKNPPPPLNKRKNEKRKKEYSKQNPNVEIG